MVARSSWVVPTVLSSLGLEARRRRLSDSAKCWARGGPLFADPRCRGRVLTAITVEVSIVVPLLVSAILLLPSVALAGPFAVVEARTCMRPGPGRHRRITRGRHAARGGCVRPLLRIPVSGLQGAGRRGRKSRSTSPRAPRAPGRKRDAGLTAPHGTALDASPGPRRGLARGQRQQFASLVTPRFQKSPTVPSSREEGIRTSVSAVEASR